MKQKTLPRFILPYSRKFWHKLYCSGLIISILRPISKSKCIVLLLILIVSIPLYSQTISKINGFRSFKASYDCSDRNENSKLKSAAVSSSRKKVQTNTWEYSLMYGGYFTLGTNQGISDSKIDDNCQVTFGHPYATTSFAYLILDGNALKPESASLNEKELVNQSGDTIKTELTYTNRIKATTNVFVNQNGNTQLSFTAVNTDSVSHKIGLAMLFDAALGKWGDGFVLVNDTFLSKVYELKKLLPDSIIIWERKSNPNGIGVSVKFKNNKPGSLKFGNWYDEYSGINSVSELYDLAIQSKWNDSLVQPNQMVSFTVEFSLLKPDYNNNVFLRCDMPNAMSIENNLLFPGSLFTNFEILNNASQQTNLTIKIKDSDNIFPWQSDKPFNIEANQSLFYTSAFVKIPEIYDTTLVPVTFSLMQSGTVIDEITKFVLIPASPFSNAGLEVTIDSNYTSYTKKYLRFHAIKQATQQILSGISKNNVFFYQNETRITDFNFEKDTTGGTNNADIVFVLDVTGSMAEEIAGVRDNIIEFADSLSYRGIDVQLGMITFLDAIENTYAFTNDAQLFRDRVQLQYAHGGDDQAENSLEALMAATQFNFRKNANRIIIWITDADYHINDRFTRLVTKDVADALVANNIRVYSIGDLQFQTAFYDPIVLNTGGNFYDINGKFRDILLDVSRFGESPNFLLSFYPKSPLKENDVLKVELHYSGLGGADTLVIGSTLKSLLQPENMNVVAYPNPVSNNTIISFNANPDLIYNFELFSISGQKLNSITAKAQGNNLNVPLSSILKSNAMEPDKVYILSVKALNNNGSIEAIASVKLRKLK